MIKSVSSTIILVVLIALLNSGCQQTSAIEAGQKAIDELAQQGVKIEDIASVSITTKDGEKIDLTSQLQTVSSTSELDAIGGGTSGDDTTITTENVIDHTEDLTPGQEVNITVSDDENIATGQEDSDQNNPLAGALVSIDEKYITVKATFDPDYPKPSVIFECQPLRHTGFLAPIKNAQGTPKEWLRLDPVTVGNDDLAALSYTELMTKNTAYRVRILAVPPVWGLKKKVIWETQSLLTFDKKLKEGELTITNCQCVPADVKGAKRKFKIWMKGRKGRAAYHLGYKFNHPLISKFAVYAKNICEGEDHDVFYCEILDPKNSSAYSMVPEVYILSKTYSKIKHIELKKEWLVKAADDCTLGAGQPVD